jgi:hypothetical protein
MGMESIKRENVSHEVNKCLPNGQMYRRLIGQTEKPVEVRVRELTFTNDTFSHPAKQVLLRIQTNLLFTQKWVGKTGQIPLMAPRLGGFKMKIPH